MDQASIDISQRVREYARRFGLAAFWRWWVGELAPLAPTSLRTALVRRRLRPVLAFETDAVVVWSPVMKDGGVAFVETGRIRREGDAAAIRAAGRAAIDALPRSVYAGELTRPNVVVALPSGTVLRKLLTMPAAVERDLKQTLAYDLDRHTPFKPDELYFDAVVVARDAVKKEIRLDWAAARRTVVDATSTEAEDWGANVVAVTPDAPGPRGPSARVPIALNLLPESNRPGSTWWRRWHLWAPLAALAVAIMVAVILPIVQKRSDTIALIAITEEARAKAEASSALRSQLEQLTTDYNYALGRKYAYPSAVQVLDDVTKLLPDDTWLTQLEVKSGVKGKDSYREMLLKGESATAGRLVSLLEDSHEFEGAAPRSPTLKIQPGTGEIFDLGARVKPLPPPAMIQIATTVPVEEKPAVPAAAAPANNAAPSTDDAASAATSTAAPASRGAPAAAPGTAPAPSSAASASGTPGSGSAPAAAPANAPSVNPAPAPAVFGPPPPIAPPTAPPVVITPSAAPPTPPAAPAARTEGASVVGTPPPAKARQQPGMQKE